MFEQLKAMSAAKVEEMQRSLPDKIVVLDTQVGQRAPAPAIDRGYMSRRRVAAAGATWIFRGGVSRRRRGCHVDIPRRRIAAAAGATWISRGGVSRRRRGCHVDIP